MTAIEIIRNEQRIRAERGDAIPQYAIGNSRFNEPDSCIGAWVEEKGRYVIIASKVLHGGWCAMPYEILINGEAPPVNWTPVE